MVIDPGAQQAVLDPQAWAVFLAVTGGWVLAAGLAVSLALGISARAGRLG